MQQSHRIRSAAAVRGNRGVWEAVSSGMIAWLVQRITAIVLLVLVPLKIYTGWVVVGKVSGSVGWAAAFHGSMIVDSLMLLAVIFHIAYGIRIILIDFGWVRQGDMLFKVFTVLSILLFLLAAYFVF